MAEENREMLEDTVDDGELEIDSSGFTRETSIKPILSIYSNPR